MSFAERNSEVFAESEEKNGRKEKKLKRKLFIALEKIVHFLYFLYFHLKKIN